MTIIDVKASTEYQVKIGQNILQSIGKEMAELNLKGKTMIVSDDNVAPLYLETVKSSLLEFGYEVFSFIIPHGEGSKNAENLIALLEAAAENNLSRSDTFIALGGGVVGDLCGFGAATFLRGVNFVQIPTSLLAAVDSSVGGKTAIDLKAGKNLAGAFYQPKLVLCDTQAFSTLPPDEFANGMAEVIKYGMFCDSEFLDLLNQENDCERTVAHCVKIKAQVVAADEFDKGERMILNFGHTVAHAVEALSGYTVAHGCAVAIGMAVITRAAVKRQECDKQALDTLLKLLEKYNLPSECKYNAEEIFKVTLKDKKNADGKITLVIPTEKGKAELKKANYDTLKEYIEFGLN